MYVNISGHCEDDIGYVASQQINHSVLGLCVIRNWRQCWCLIKWPRSCGNTRSWRLIQKVDHCRLNLICSLLTIPAINNECPNLGRPTCFQALRSMVPTTHATFPHVKALIRLSNLCNDKEKLQQPASTEILTYVRLVDNGGYKQRRVHKDVVDGIGSWTNKSDAFHFAAGTIYCLKGSGSRTAALGHRLIGSTTVCGWSRCGECYRICLPGQSNDLRWIMLKGYKIANY